MTIIRKLNKCPFCGYEYSQIVRHYVSRGYYIECTYCGASGSPGETEQKAIENWNRRREEWVDDEED